MCEFELPDVSLRCFVARQLLLQIYALSSVKFSELKLWLCKKCDKYEVWVNQKEKTEKSLSQTTNVPNASQRRGQGKQKRKLKIEIRNQKNEGKK